LRSKEENRKAKSNVTDERNGEEGRPSVNLERKKVLLCPAEGETRPWGKERNLCLQGGKKKGAYH